MSTYTKQPKKIARRTLYTRALTSSRPLPGSISMVAVLPGSQVSVLPNDMHSKRNTDLSVPLFKRLPLSLVIMVRFYLLVSHGHVGGGNAVG